MDLYRQRIDRLNRLTESRAKYQPHELIARALDKDPKVVDVEFDEFDHTDHVYRVRLKNGATVLVRVSQPSYD